MAGLFGWIKLAGVLIFAIPAALAGLEFLIVRGDHVTGAILLVLAVSLVLVQRRLSSIVDLRNRVLSTLIGSKTERVPDED